MNDLPKGVTKRHRQGFLVLEVDTAKTNFKGLSWSALGSFGKRKFENFLVITNSKEGVVKVLYV